MIEVDPNQLKAAVESQHGGAAELIQSVHVKETFGGKVVWDGFVHVFEMTGDSKIERVYAWSSPIEGSEKRRFFTVQHIGGITSPQAAVRAAIVAEYRSTHNNDES